MERLKLVETVPKGRPVFPRKGGRPKTQNPCTGGITVTRILSRPGPRKRPGPVHSRRRRSRDRPATSTSS
jgi:hypothetical protein